MKHINKNNVYLFEINDVIANQMKLPYSTGLIWSYCVEDQSIRDNYVLDGWFYYRDDERNLETIFEDIEDPTIVGFNCFVWNWEFNKKMAKKIKDKFPNSVIVFGGWQQPIASKSQGFFEEHNYVDILVHGEGEVTFKDLLLEYIKEEPDWNSVAGCSVKQSDLTTFVTPTRERIQDLNSMPSPYLNGLFDEIAKSTPYILESTIETTRGCPYKCTYCEIGTLYYQKIKWQKLEKVFKEIDWISDNKVEFVYNADSNFGMLPDHLPVTQYLVDKKKATGYPVGHRCDWAKNKADKVIELAKLFYDANMDKGITIALQSMHEPTLKAIKRKNVDDGKLEEFLKMYNDWDLPSYVEIILGLPEETYSSFTSGVCKVMELDQHNYIGIYPLTAFPNTPFGDPEYVEKYGLKVVKTYTAFMHYDISEQNDFERETMIVGSDKMTHDEYKKAYYFRWKIMYGHYLGVTQFISRFLRKYLNVTYRDFYEGLLQYSFDNPDSFMGVELQHTIDALEGIIAVERPWGRVVDDVKKNFAWDFEEATVIKIMQNKSVFYAELWSYITESYEVPTDVLMELFKYQMSSVIDPSVTYPIRKKFTYNIDEVVKQKKPLRKYEHELEFTADNYNGDLYEWGKIVLWWGRRVGACKTKVRQIGESTHSSLPVDMHVGTLRG
tara:strand:+ start:2787 stop:4784 length:1998 start_codon:yes stop_codon:yes gene_type:complete